MTPPRSGSGKPAGNAGVVLVTLAAPLFSYCTQKFSIHYEASSRISMQFVEAQDNGHIRSNSVNRVEGLNVSESAHISNAAARPNEAPILDDYSFRNSVERKFLRLPKFPRPTARACFHR